MFFYFNWCVLGRDILFFVFLVFIILWKFLKFVEIIFDNVLFVFEFIWGVIRILGYNFISCWIVGFGIVFYGLKDWKKIFVLFVKILVVKLVKWLFFKVFKIVLLFWSFLWVVLIKILFFFIWVKNFLLIIWLFLFGMWGIWILMILFFVNNFLSEWNVNIFLVVFVWWIL